MSSRPEGIHRFAFIEKDSSLAFPYCKLGAVFYFPGTCLGKPMNQLTSGIVEPLQIFQKYKVVCSHMHFLRFSKLRLYGYMQQRCQRVGIRKEKIGKSESDG